MEAAALHSQDMARLDMMAHNLPGGSLASLTDRAAYVHYSYQLLGENIAFNRADASSLIAAWMNSPPHAETCSTPLSPTQASALPGTAREGPITR